jgi:hypothetical protein
MTSDVTQLITELTSQRFYGSLEIKFEAGRVVLLKKTETVKPTESMTSTRPNPNQPSTKQSETNNGKHYTPNSR